jgi:hypothetical protein
VSQQDPLANVIAVELVSNIDRTITSSVAPLVVGGVSIPSGATVILGAQADNLDGIYSVTYNQTGTSITGIVWTFVDFVDPLGLVYVRTRLNQGISLNVFWDAYADAFTPGDGKPKIAFSIKKVAYSFQRQPSIANIATEIHTARVYLWAPSYGSHRWARSFLFEQVKANSNNNMYLLEPGEFAPRGQGTYGVSATFAFELTSQLNRYAAAYIPAVCTTTTLDTTDTPGDYIAGNPNGF